MARKETHTYVVNVGTEKSPMYEAFWKTTIDSSIKHVLIKTPDFDAAIAALNAIEKERGCLQISS
jgi:hypothetical protein